MAKGEGERERGLNYGASNQSRSCPPSRAFCCRHLQTEQRNTRELLLYEHAVIYLPASQGQAGGGRHRALFSYGLPGARHTSPLSYARHGISCVSACPSDRINIIPGTTVTVIDPRDDVLGFADRELAQALCYSMRKNGARFLMGEKVLFWLCMLACTALVCGAFQGCSTCGHQGTS